MDPNLTATWTIFENARTRNDMHERHKEVEARTKVPKLKTNQINVEEVMTSDEVKNDTQKEIKSDTKPIASKSKPTSEPVQEKEKEKEKEKKKIPMSDIRLMTMDEWAMESFKS